MKKHGEKKRREKKPKWLRHVYSAAVDPKPEDEIICCVDPRFEQAFEEFIRKGLGISDGKRIFLAIAGGPAPLAHPNEMRSRCRYIVRQTLFACDHFPIRRIIIIGHQDCGYYNVIPKNGNDAANRERADLPLAIKQLDLVVPEGVKIEAYYAKFTDESRTKIVFEKI